MTYIIVVFGVLVALGLAWFSYEGGKPVAHRPITAAMLDALLEALLYRGTAQSSLQIQTLDGERRFLLRKYIRHSAPDGSTAGIVGELRAEDVGTQTVEKFRTELQARGIPFTEGAGGASVDFGTDLRLSAEVVRLAFERVLDVHFGTQTVGYFKDLLPLEIPRLTGIARPPGPSGTARAV